MKLLITIAVLVSLLISVPVCADEATVLIAASDKDGYVWGEGATWAIACATGFGGNSSFSVLQVGNDHDGGASRYRRWKGIAIFDLTALSGTINTVTLWLYCYTKTGDNSFVVDIKQFATNPDPIDKTDFEASAPTLLAQKSVADFSTSTWATFTLATATLSLGEVLALRIEYNDTGYCLIVPHDPPGDDWLNRLQLLSKDWINEGDDTRTPYLVIDYTPPVAGKAAYGPRVDTHPIINGLVRAVE